MESLESLLNKDIKDYNDVENFLYAVPKFTKKTSLSHTKELLKRLGRWEHQVPHIHVAGTNGKGSVCAYLQSLLKEYGYTVGGFVSPHLVTMHERFLINGKPVSDELFMDSFFEVLEASKEAIKDGVSFPTFFEYLFLMGMIIFGKSGIDILVLETGLGGRLDATNVFEKTDVCVLTTIGLDHCQYLGDTVEQIASEKAGIIKKDANVVYINKSDSVSEIFKNQTNKMQATDCCIQDKGFFIEKIQHKGVDFSYKSRYYNYISLTMSTNALYQVENASLALCAFESFIQSRDLEPMALEKMQKAIKDTFWEGRMEEVMEGVYFDGAHNENGVEAFLDSVRAIECDGKRILCFSVVDDKDYKKMITLLCESGLFSTVVAVQMEDSRGVSLDRLQELFSQYKDIEVIYKGGTEAGIDACLRMKNKPDQIYIVGSLYLVGLVKGVFRRKYND